MASHKNPTFQPTLVEKSLAGHNISTNSCRKITGRPNIALAGPISYKNIFIQVINYIQIHYIITY